MGKKAGRPTAFKSEFTEQLIEYFDVAPYAVKTKTVNIEGSFVKVPYKEANDFPTLAGFAIKIGVHRDTLHEWASSKDENGKLKHPEFSDAYKRAKDYQENFLVINGLRGLLPGNFGIFTAKNVLNWRDKKPDEVEVIVNNLHDLSNEEIDAKIQDHLKLLGSESEKTKKKKG